MSRRMGPADTVDMWDQHVMMSGLDMRYVQLDLVKLQCRRVVYML